MNNLMIKKKLISIINERIKLATTIPPSIPDFFSNFIQLNAIRLDQHFPIRYIRKQYIELSLCLYYKKPDHIKSNYKKKQINNTKYSINTNTRYTPYTNRFPIINQYKNSELYHNTAIPLYQNSFPSANHSSAILLHYISSILSGLTRVFDLEGYIEGSVYSKENSSLIS
ncbi:uncharacterized protein EAE98_008973 [Botrytis deweyae]|uniref:Uncharacterized protein n=1 Tax=Botrytis deweyae TaxID=2478750 RepID=A0ABQ7ICM3_9HELO|nr:uncharacterized protein EAE98_008973 [Botrytis deweyae]KAF7920280.1 hypothetical protein EAE98_008973 [Botrytis deweyae]